ncbi:uncharacterized protein LOC114350673 isoform X2 [Ostrinia furnacalis]|uniref:uncharacterized protein LOC114350673 isoform X2 n=1 Tax=Ostrinia furnacalis TaxID=93504 RepID=UPI00103E1C63|nr:uncharacterized protein LOC114350673 isoform X2 [Ostrinia furnacalis]
MIDVRETNVSLTIPFSSSETANLVQEVLNVDKELKGSGVSRTITSDQDTLHIDFKGGDLKKLRVAVNSMIKNILLVVKTINQFEV